MSNLHVHVFWKVVGLFRSQVSVEHQSTANHDDSIYVYQFSDDRHHGANLTNHCLLPYLKSVPELINDLTNGIL